MELLHAVHSIEQRLGRVRKERWGPRAIDIDLLHIPGVTMDTPELTLPHPCLTKRAFVLIPLDEIAADEFSGCLAECQDNSSHNNLLMPQKLACGQFFSDIRLIILSCNKYVADGELRMICSLVNCGLKLKFCG